MESTERDARDDARSEWGMKQELRAHRSPLHPPPPPLQQQQQAPHRVAVCCCVVELLRLNPLPRLRDAHSRASRHPQAPLPWTTQQQLLERHVHGLRGHGLEIDQQRERPQQHWRRKTQHWRQQRIHDLDRDCDWQRSRDHAHHDHESSHGLQARLG